MARASRIPVVILGTGGHAKVVIEILEAEDCYDIVGLCWDDTNPERLVAGYSIIGDEAIWRDLLTRGVTHAAIGFGGWTDNQGRKTLYEEATKAGFDMVTAVHPKAIVSPSATIGSGSVVFPGAILHSEVVVGENSIVATGSSVDHESVVGDHVLVSAGVSVGAHVHIGDEALLAIGSVVISNVSIGDRALVAAGAVVVANVPAVTAVFGVPARERAKGS